MPRVLNAILQPRCDPMPTVWLSGAGDVAIYALVESDKMNPSPWLVFLDLHEIAWKWMEKQLA